MGCLHGFGVNCKEPVDLTESCQRAAKLCCQRKTLAAAYEHHRGMMLSLLLLRSVSSDSKMPQL